MAIASDLRLGINQNQTAAVDYSKLHKIHDRLYVGLTGLIADQLTLVQKLRFKHDMYELRENRKMSPKVFGSVVSATLYEKRQRRASALSSARPERPAALCAEAPAAAGARASG